MLELIGGIILAILGLERFVYGKQGKEQGTVGRGTRRVVNHLAGFVTGINVNSDKILVRKKNNNSKEEPK